MTLGDELRDLAERLEAATRNHHTWTEDQWEQFRRLFEEYTRPGWEHLTSEQEEALRQRMEELVEAATVVRKWRANGPAPSA